MSRNSRVSARSQRLWERLAQWYGAERISKAYGDHPPEDWCAVVDKADNETVRIVLSMIREKHPTFPPTFPEFEQLFGKARQPKHIGPSIQSLLDDFVMKTKQLTFTQARGPWHWIRRDGQCVGVIIAADGDHPGYRVMVEDMTKPIDSGAPHVVQESNRIPPADRFHDERLRA